MLSHFIFGFRNHVRWMIENEWLNLTVKLCYRKDLDEKMKLLEQARPSAGLIRWRLRLAFFAIVGISFASNWHFTVHVVEFATVDPSDDHQEYGQLLEKKNASNAFHGHPGDGMLLDNSKASNESLPSLYDHQGDMSLSDKNSNISNVSLPSLYDHQGDAILPITFRFENINKECKS